MWSSIVSNTEYAVELFGLILHEVKELKQKESYSDFINTLKNPDLSKYGKEKWTELKALSKLSTDLEKLEYNLSDTDIFSKSFYAEIDYCTGNCINGYGVFNYHNKGLQYIGQWNNKLRNGKGKLYLNKRLVYDGEWKDDKFHGRGKYYKDGELLYNGRWANGENID